jgi:hypothetical protein
MYYRDLMRRKIRKMAGVPQSDIREWRRRWRPSSFNFTINASPTLDPDLDDLDFTMATWVFLEPMPDKTV